MKYTLLQLVQAVLSSIDGDEVSNINDTVESSQVVEVIKQNYFDIIGSLDLPEHYGYFQLNASGDNTKPILMTVPEGILSIEWIKYNHQESSDTDLEYKTINYLEQDQFIERMFTMNSGDADVGSMTTPLGGSDDMVVLFKNDAMPTYWTSPDDSNILFNSYDSSEENTLQKSNTYCYGLIAPVFTESNTFVPDIDAAQHQVLLQEAKRQATVELRQFQNPNAEEKSRRNRIRATKNKRTAPGKEQFKSRLPNYGRNYHG